MGRSIRDVYGETLADLGAEFENLVVLDADLAGSTKSKMFGERYPDRFFNMGIAESDMVSCAAGLAAVGKIAVVNSFTCFLTTMGLVATRGQICYGDFNVKLAGAYCGLSDALDGATHHATDDIAFMRALPTMRIVVPSDAESTRWATRWALETEGPVYLRLSRTEYPDLYPVGTAFEPGRAKIVRPGRDCTVFAIGILVHKALEAAEMLAAEGIDVRVVDLLSVKPIDAECVAACARETGAVVCAEEHTILGGAGSAVAEVLAHEGVGAPTEFVGIQDHFTETGKYDAMMTKYGLDGQAVAAAVKKAMARK